MSSQAMALATTVERLRAEIETLHKSMRSRAVVDRATGMLAERVSCGIDEAHDHLTLLARQNGMGTETAAALLLGVAFPPADNAPAAQTFDPATYLRAASHRVAASLDADTTESIADLPSARFHLSAATLRTARTPDELARFLCQEARAQAALVAMVEPDRALRIVGAHGLPAQVVSEWARIPPQVEVPLARAVRIGRALWPQRAGELTQIGKEAVGKDVRACLPIQIEGRAFAAVELIFTAGDDLLDADCDLVETERDHVSGLVEACGRRLREIIEGNDASAMPATADAPWLRAVLDAIPGPAALLSPVREESPDGEDADGGRIVDFQIDACNQRTVDAQSRGPAELVGRRLLEIHPGLALNGLFEAYVRVLESGVPLDLGPHAEVAVRAGRFLASNLSVRACRLGDGLLVSWMFHDDSQNLAAQLVQAQRLGGLGWGQWNLSTGAIDWSDQLYTIFDQQHDDGPLTLSELTSLVLPEDLPVVETMLRSMLERHRRGDCEFRVRCGAEVRHLRVMSEPVPDILGEPVAIRAVVQDVTRRRRTELALDASRHQLERQQLRIERERHVAVELQRAILPQAREPRGLPGIQVAVRYLPAESETRVGGDWYEATELPDGDTFLAIGDVSGHGLPAAAGMSLLRHALAGLACTGAPSDQLLTWLNQMLCHRVVSLTASAIAARFDPVTRRLTWAQAGHPPPVLVTSDGKALMLEQPAGVLLGVADDMTYATTTEQLGPDDLLVFYTDGLIERRRHDLSEGMDRLLIAAEDCVKTSPDRAIDHILDVMGVNPDDDACLVAVRILT